MIEVSIESVRINQAKHQQMVILKELHQDRYLCISIAHTEAYAIVAYLQGTRSPRPLSPDLMKNLVEATGAKVLWVVISDLAEGPIEKTGLPASATIFSAQIILDVAGKEVEIDARPSDALSLAMRANASMFVTEHVFEQHGVQSDHVGAPFPLQAGPKQAEQEPPVGDPDGDAEVSLATTLLERLVQVEEELRKAQERIAELESQ
jgi:bifunctional DNase/RNase